MPKKRFPHQQQRDTVQAVANVPLWKKGFVVQMCYDQGSNAHHCHYSRNNLERRRLRKGVHNAHQNKQRNEGPSQNCKLPTCKATSLLQSLHEKAHDRLFIHGWRQLAIAAVAGYEKKGRPKNMKLAATIQAKK